MVMGNTYSNRPHFDVVLSFRQMISKLLFIAHAK